MRTWSEGKGVLGFACYKAGMTTVYVKNTVKDSPSFGQLMSFPVTVLDAPPLLVSGLRFYSGSDCGPTVWSSDKNIQKMLSGKLGMENTTNSLDKIDVSKYGDVRLIVLTQPQSSGLGKKNPELFELCLGGKYEDKVKQAKESLGKEIRPGDVLKEGEYADVTGITKGKGFTGPVKRFGITIQGRKNEKHHRHVGAHHAETPGKMDFRTPSPGQHGFHQRTELNKLVIGMGDDPGKVNPEGGFPGYGLVKGNYVLVKGSVPGPKKRLIILKKPVRPSKKGMEVKVEEIDKTSQQGV